MWDLMDHHLISIKIVEDLLDENIEQEDVSENQQKEEAPNSPPSVERYVYDIDEDGIPELLFPLQDGLHIYQLINEQYTLLPIFFQKLH